MLEPLDFLFQQRGATAMAASGAVPPSGDRFAQARGYGSNGEPINPQAMSAAEFYRGSFAINRR